jgi:hypothetical protein
MGLEAIYINLLPQLAVDAFIELQSITGRLTILLDAGWMADLA